MKDEVTRKIEEMKQKYGEFIENFNDGILVVDKKGYIPFFNKKILEMTKYSEEELKKTHFSKLVHPSDLDALLKGHKNVMDGKYAPERYEFQILDKNGNSFYVEGNFRRIKEDGIIGTLCILRNIDERKKTEEKLSAIYELSRKMTLSLDFDEIISMALYIARRIMEFDTFGILLVDEEKDELYVAGYYGKEERLKDFRIPVKSKVGITAYVARTGKPYYSPDVTKDKLYLKFLPSTKSELAVPLKVGDKVLGVIDAESEKTDAFSESDFILMNIFASQVALALQNYRLFKNISDLKDFNENIVRYMEEGILIEDSLERITYVNPKFSEMLGYSREEIVGKHWREIVPEEYWEIVEKELEKRPKNIKSRYETILVTKDKEQMPVIVAATPLFDDGGFRGVLSVFTDIGERKKLENKLATIYKMGQEMSRTVDLDEILKITLDTVQRELNFNLIAIFLVDEKTRELYIAEQRGYSEENEKLRLPLDGKRGITVWVAKNEKPLIVPDVSKDSRYVEADPSIKSEIAVPIKVGKRVLGVLNVESEELNAFDKRDLKLLEALANQAGIAIENARFYERLKGLKDFSENIIKNSPFGVVTTDERGNVTSANPKALEILGSPSEEKTKKLNILNLETIKSIKKTKEFEKILFEGKSINIESEHTSFWGKKSFIHLRGVPIKERGEVVGSLLIFDDISERKKSEEKLRELKEFNETIIQTMDEGILIEDSKGIITFVNRKTCEMLSYSEEDLVGKHWSKIVPKEFIPRVKEETKKRPKGIRSRYEAAIVGKDGKKIPIIITATPLFENGNFKGVLSVFTDIGEKREREREREILTDIATRIMQEKDLQVILGEIAGAVKNYCGFGRVAISVIDENFDVLEVAFAGLDEEEIEILKKRKMSPEERKMIFDERFRISKSYYISHNMIPWKDDKGLKGKIPKEKTIDWHPDDYLFIPLMGREGKVIGIMSLDDPVDGRAPDEERLKPMEMFASQAAIAIENAKSFKEEAKRRLQLETINDLGKRITKSLDIDELLETTVRVIHESFNYHDVLIAFVDHETNELVMMARAGAYERDTPKRCRRKIGDKGIIDWVAKNGKTLLVKDVSKDERYVCLNKETKSELCVPMLMGEKTIGLINIESDRIDAFDEEDVKAMETLADQLTIGIEKIRLYHELKDYAKELEKRVEEKTKRTEQLLKTSYSLRGVNEWSKGMNIILEGITKGVALDNAYLFLVNERKNLLRCEAEISSQNLKGSSISLDDYRYVGVLCVRNKKPYNIKNAMKDERVKKQIGKERKAFAWVPIVAKDEVLGAISVDNEKSGREITSEDIKTLELFATQAAIFIDKMKLAIEPVIEKSLKTEMKYHLDPMESYIVFEEGSKTSFEIFQDHVLHGIPGFVVARTHPKKIRDIYELKKTPIIWLSTMEMEDALHPQNLEKLIYVVKQFLKVAENSIVLLEGFEYLVTQNNFTSVIKNLYTINDYITLSNSRLLIPVNPDVLSKKELHLLEKEFVVWKK